MDSETRYWSNSSVLNFVGEADPIEFIAEKAKEVVMKALQAGWHGPPFDPFELATLLQISTIPKEDVQDARVSPSGSQCLQIEYNPNRPRGRVRFSVAHEIAHTFFPDCKEHVRNRTQVRELKGDDWQLELLCNIAASEILMPTGCEIDSRVPVSIDRILKLQKHYDVSMEAISTRLAKLTLDQCTLLAASRVNDVEGEEAYRIDYSIPSRTSTIKIPTGLVVHDKTMSLCTAVGYTASGNGRLSKKSADLHLECVGIPPYPGRKYPRVIAIVRDRIVTDLEGLKLVSVYGDALEPRGNGPKIIAQIVNDKTPNWGAGFARAVRIRYPSAQKEFRDWCLSDSLNFMLGNNQVTEISPELFIVSMIAQHGYGESLKPRIRYAALNKCLRNLKDIAIQKRATIHMPRIGSGYAGGNWPFIVEMIDDALIRNGVGVSIYSLPGSDFGDSKEPSNHGFNFQIETC